MESLKGTLADGDVAPGEEAELERGATLERYVILDKIGAGGMGVVFSAYDPQLDRRIAIKLLHGDEGPGSASSNGHARLLREAQAMARISHANVIAIHDVGSYRSSVFLAMEFVDGVTAAQWLEQRERTLEEILSVYRGAARGLMAAHEVGLVHRDFKPDNMMVDHSGRVRVMDFGLARASASSTSHDRERAPKPKQRPVEEALSTPLTGHGAVLGTPAYMAPEQHLGTDVDARADQFAFCVALYEALYGERPYPGETLGELVFNITEGNVRESSGGRSVPSWLRAVLVRGLAPNPEDRWPTMDAVLARLEHDPDRRRTRALGIGVVAVLAGGGAIAVWGNVSGPQLCDGADEKLVGVWDDDARGRVKNALVATQTQYGDDSWRAVKERLDGYARRWSAGHRDACEATHVRREQSGAALDLRMACLERHRRVLSELVTILGEADSEVAAQAPAAVANLPELSACADVSALKRRVAPPTDRAVARRVDAIAESLARAQALHLAGRYGEGRALVKGLLEQAKATDYAPVIARTKYALAIALDDDGSYEEALAQLTSAYVSAVEHGQDELAVEASVMAVYVAGERLVRPEAAARWQRDAQAWIGRNGASPNAVASLHNNVGVSAYRSGDYERARREYSEALRLRQERPEPSNYEIARAMTNLGLAEERLGQLEAATEHHRQAIDTLESVVGPRHPKLAELLGNLGNSELERGRSDEARAAYERARAIETGALGPEHPKVATTLLNLGNVAWQQGELGEATELMEQALKIRTAILGETHPDTAIVLVNLAVCDLDRGADARAVARGDEALRSLERSFGPEHPHVAVALHNQGIALRQLGRPDEALARFKRAWEIRETAFGAEHTLVAESRDDYGAALRDLGHYDEALAHHRTALEALERGLGPQHPQVATALGSIAETYRAMGRDDEAVEHYRRATDVGIKAHGADHPDVATLLVGEAEVELRRRRVAEALRAASRAVEIRESKEGDPARLAEARMVLARALCADGQREQGRRRLDQALAHFSAVDVAPPADAPVVARSCGTASTPRG